MLCTPTCIVRDKIKKVQEKFSFRKVEKEDIMGSNYTNLYLNINLEVEC